MRGNTLDALRRGYLSLVRGTIHKVNDSPKMQTVDARLLHNELIDNIEHVQHYGFSSVPLPPETSGRAAELIVGFLTGNRSHPVVLAVDDRRYRPKNYKPGESAHFDDQGQYSKVSRDGHHRVAKQHTMTAVGEGVAPGGTTKPDTTFELNEQLKGLSARLAQAEHNLHGLFDVTSKFREIVQGAIPEVAQVAPILNQLPTGLTAMADAIQGKEMQYLQTQVEQALAKFLTPNLGGLATLLGGGLEQAIGDLKGQIESLAAGNPVVGQVEALAADLQNLQASGAASGVIDAGVTALQAEISALTAANPIIAQVGNLRTSLQGLLEQAGPALNFLGPQKRLVQGLSKSLTLVK